MEWTPYWIFPQDGDPLPLIGSGFRHVLVNFGKKFTRIKLNVEAEVIRIPSERWRYIPNVEDKGQSLLAVLEAIRPTEYNPDGRRRSARSSCSTGGCDVEKST